MLTLKELWMKSRFGLVIVMTLTILAVGCGEGKSDAPEMTSAAGVSAKSVLNFSLKDMDGNTVDLAQYHGKVVILDVWDTWCPPCRKEIPEFVQLYDEYRNQGLEIIGVALARKGVPEVKQFAQQYKINYTNLIGEPIIYQIFGQIQGIPTTFVIDKTGELKNKHVGYTSKAVFEKEIKELLGS
jgi:cytochrome c biogenesis protein CcmG/thiol:disulfide interchange protein DsbE